MQESPPTHTELSVAVNVMDTERTRRLMQQKLDMYRLESFNALNHAACLAGDRDEAQDTIEQYCGRVANEANLKKIDSAYEDHKFWREKINDALRKNRLIKELELELLVRTFPSPVIKGPCLCLDRKKPRSVALNFLRSRIISSRPRPILSGCMSDVRQRRRRLMRLKRE